MGNAYDSSIEYLVFALVFFVALGAISLWLYRGGRSTRWIALAWVILVCTLIPGWFFVQAAVDNERERRSRAISGMAPTYAYELQALGHHLIQLDTPPDDPRYLQMIEKQKAWLYHNQNVADIYTFRKGEKGNALIVDSETDYDGDGEIDTSEDSRELRSAIGQEWEEEGPYLEQAYAGIAGFDDEPYEDFWGVWVSAYAPMRGPDGSVEAVLGVDFSASEWMGLMERARHMALVQLAVFLVSVLGLVIVIAMQRANLRQRQRAAERTRAIIDQAHEAFVAMDERGRVIDWNPQATAVFGWQRSEALGQDVASLLIPERFHTAHREGLKHYLETRAGKVVGGRIEVMGVHCEGHEIPLELTITAIHDGTSSRFHAFLHDISDRKEREVQLRNAKDDAEAATRVKSEFIASVSHEIRTPLNGILGMGELLASTDLDERQERYLTQLQSSSETLLHLLNDVLDMSRLESGKIELEVRPFDLRAILDTVSHSIRPRAERKGLAYSTHVEEDVPRVVHGDPSRLSQVLANLLSNALKFTREGSIDVRVGLEGPPSDEGVVLRFSVADTGIGVPPARQDSIFEAFRQEDASTTRRYGGTGLGLSICRHLVKRMGGTLALDSVVQGGSTFAFTARFGRGRVEELGSVEVGALHAAGPPDAAGPLRVLLAEDGKVNQQVAVGLLGLDGHTVHVVEDGKQAVQAVQADDFDVVLMDLQMPEMDGLDATRVIRELEGPDGPHVPIVALTAIAMRGDRERCMRAGMDAYISKPVDRIELQETLRAVVRRRRPAESAPAPDESAGPGSEVLVDWGVAARRISGGARGIRELAKLMRTEGPRLLKQLREARDADRAEDVRLAAHTLRGSAHHFGAQALVDVALHIEALAREGDLGAIDSLLPALGRHVDTLESALALVDDLDLSPWVSA